MDSWHVGREELTEGLGRSGDDPEVVVGAQHYPMSPGQRRDEQENGLTRVRPGKHDDPVWTGRAGERLVVQQPMQESRVSKAREGVAVPAGGVYSGAWWRTICSDQVAPDMGNARCGNGAGPRGGADEAGGHAGDVAEVLAPSTVLPSSGGKKTAEQRVEELRQRIKQKQEGLAAACEG